LILLLWSRFGLLASGPWEWDECNFSRGLIDFDLAAHFPHPPGFPGWIAIGRIIRWLVPVVPITALQVASAAASIVTVWLAASLARRVVNQASAVASALVMATLPGIWLFSVRGFASTTATTFVLAAAVILAAPHSRPRLTAASLATAAAVLIRPQLLPVAAVLWVAGVVRGRSLRDALPGAAAGITLVAIALTAMASATGGWAPMVAAFVDHGSRHFSRLANNPSSLADLGIVKGAGGLVTTACGLILVAIGLETWRRRRGVGEAMVYVLVVGLLIAELVLIHNRTYVRYPVPLLVALAPLVAAGTVRLLGPRFAVLGLAGAAAMMAVVSLPLVSEQHYDQLPAWRAVSFAHDAAARAGVTVIEEASLHPLASYRWYEEAERLGHAGPPLVLSPWAPEPWAGVEGHYLVVTDHPELYLGPLVAGAIRWRGPSDDLEPLTQQRMLDAAVIADPPLPIGQWWAVETTPAGHRFMWGGLDCAVDLPPIPPQTFLILDLAPALGPSPLVLEVDGTPIEVIDGMAGRIRVQLPAIAFRSRSGHRIRFLRAEASAPGHGDDRPLSIQLFAIRAVGPDIPYGGPIASPQDRERLATQILGAWGPETFGIAGRGTWLRPQAALQMPGGPGTVTLRAWAPRTDDAEARVVTSSGHVVPLGLTHHPQDLVIDVGPTDAGPDGLVLRLESRPFIPARTTTSPDTRELGFVLGEIGFSPPGWPSSPVWWLGHDHPRSLDSVAAQQ
jgi:hypothetical protein